MSIFSVDSQWQLCGPLVFKKDMNLRTDPRVKCSSTSLARITLGLLVVFGSKASTSTAQEIQPPQAPPSTVVKNVDRVLVPVVVRDNQGHVVVNLDRRDFQIFDGGKPRAISGFSIEKHTALANPAGSGSPSANGAPPSSPPPAIPKRIIVFLFDDLHLSFEDLAHVQEASNKALSVLSDSDMAAVVTISGVNSGLTRDHQKLHDAIMKIKPVGGNRASASECPSIGYYQANLIEYHHDSAATADAVAQVFSCDPALDRQRDQQTAARMVSSAANRVVTTGRLDIQATLSTIREIVRRMAPLPGERTLLLVSPGFLLIEPDALSAASQIVDLAAQGNVTVSTLDARGLYTTALGAGDRVAGGPGMVQYQSETRRNSMSSEENPLAEFAYGSGGTFFHNRNDLDTGFQYLTETPECVYLLDFSLHEVKPDNHYHHLRISVDREGLQLQFRQGYFSPKPEKKQ
jgi:VWFA-related protein